MENKKTTTSSAALDGKIRKKILVVEDEKPIAKALRLKLESSGFEVTSAFNGNEALELLGKGTFDLIILDLVMPGIDGFTVLSELKQRKLAMPVIAASNLGQMEDIKRAKDLGAGNYFVKSNTSLAQIVDLVKKELSVE